MHRHLLASALLPSLVALLLVATIPSAAAGTPSLPVRLPRAAAPQIIRVLPVAYDPVAMYEAQSTCDPSPKPGAVKLASLIKKTYGEGQAVGISRACTSGGTSEHKEGRALDWMTSVHSRQGLANAKAFLSWLLGPISSACLTAMPRGWASCMSAGTTGTGLPTRRIEDGPN
jgi:hypothetical protein